MKPNFLNVLKTLILGNLLFLTACTKNELKEQPVPTPTPPPGLSHSVQWTINELPGEALGPVNNLFALVTVVNDQGEPVLINKKLKISFDGKIKTEELQLAGTNHKVTGFILVDSVGTAKFAAPKAGSAKANLSGKPLPVAFILPQPVLLSVQMEVLRIQTTDTPESFGYPAGAFNNDGQNTPTDQTMYINIKLRTAIRVGEILYDSIPATVLYTYWDENQQSHGKYIVLTAGTNELQLLRAATRHHFRITKWGVSFELNLLKSEIKEAALYVLGGSREAKKLKSELTYKLVDGVYKPDTRTLFNYLANGNLSEIQYYSRKQDNSIYMVKREAFQYRNNQLEKINWFDEVNSFTGFTSFTYGPEGKIFKMVEEAITGIQTTATIDYHYSEVTGTTSLIFNYSYSHNSMNMKYYQRYTGGNLGSDNSHTSNGSTENGRYEYDNYINPYIHMGWPNLFLSNGSKNNMISQEKTYYGNYPIVVAYDFSYSYDSDGYPVELVKKYKSYLTGQHLFTTKTVFQY